MHARLKQQCKTIVSIGGDWGNILSDGNDLHIVLLALSDNQDYSNLSLISTMNSDCSTQESVRKVCFFPKRQVTYVSKLRKISFNV